MRVHPKPKRAVHAIAMRKGVGEGRTGSWENKERLKTKS